MTAQNPDKSDPYPEEQEENRGRWRGPRSAGSLQRKNTTFWDCELPRTSVTRSIFCKTIGTTKIKRTQFKTRRKGELETVASGVTKEDWVLSGLPFGEGIRNN